MFKRIVVGTDGSDTAGAAVGVAVSLAETHGAVLHLVHAYKMPTPPLGAELGLAAAGVSADELTQHGASMLERLAGDASRSGVTQVEQHLVAGSAAEAIIEVAETVDADLIVVGSRGMGGARRFLGSVPNTVTHHAPCHVLVARTEG